MQEHKEFITFSTSPEGQQNKDVKEKNKKLNHCNIQKSHAYAVIEMFPLMDEKREKIEQYMVMVRDAYGSDASSDYTGQFCAKCTDDWTDDYKSQVPYGIDPTSSNTMSRHGVFFMDIYTSLMCFQMVEYSMDRGEDGYKQSWYDVTDDMVWTDNRRFNFSPPKQDGEIYVSVQTYPNDSSSHVCYLTPDV